MTQNHLRMSIRSSQIPAPMTLAVFRMAGFLFCLCALFALSALATPAAADSVSTFKRVRLPRGVELELPKTWWLLSKEMNQTIETSVEAALDLSGVVVPEGQETNLIAANSMPRSTYAAVRVDSTTPVLMAPADIAAATPEDMRSIEAEMRQMLVKLLPNQGLRMLEFKGVRLERLSGHPVLVTEYKRTGPKGPVLVQINQVFTPTQEVRINLSYRESEGVIWMPVISKIRKSIVIRR